MVIFYSNDATNELPHQNNNNNNNNLYEVRFSSI
jgi:hypothetical protein